MNIVDSLGTKILAGVALKNKLYVKKQWQLYPLLNSAFTNPETSRLKKIKLACMDGKVVGLVAFAPRNYYNLQAYVAPD